MTWQIESFTDVDGNKDREFVNGSWTFHGARAIRSRSRSTVRRRCCASMAGTTVDAMSVSRSLWDYRDFIQGSKGEFGVAKHAYVLVGPGGSATAPSAIWLPDVPLSCRTPDGARMCRRHGSLALFVGGGGGGCA